MMSELCVKHVEGNAVLDLVTFSHKIEARVLIDKLFDQPGGSQAVDVNVPPRYPTTTLIILYPQCIALGWSRSLSDWCLRDAQKFLATFVSIESYSVTLRCEEIVRHHPFKFRMQT